MEIWAPIRFILAWENHFTGNPEAATGVDKVRRAVAAWVIPDGDFHRITKG